MLGKIFYKTLTSENITDIFFCILLISTERINIRKKRSYTRRRITPTSSNCDRHNSTQKHEQKRVDSERTHSISSRVANLRPGEMGQDFQEIRAHPLTHASRVARAKVSRAPGESWTTA